MRDFHAFCVILTQPEGQPSERKARFLRGSLTDKGRDRDDVGQLGRLRNQRPPTARFKAYWALSCSVTAVT